MILKIIHIIDFKKEVNDKSTKFNVGDHVRISKYKNIFAKGYTPNWSEEIFVIEKVKNTGHRLLTIEIIMKLLEYFMKKNYKRQININLEWKK